MKKQIILLIAVLISCLLISCDFSSIRQLKLDSYYFTKTEPFEWDKDYVLAATNFPLKFKYGIPKQIRWFINFLCVKMRKNGGKEVNVL